MESVRPLNDSLCYYLQPSSLIFEQRSIIFLHYMDQIGVTKGLANPMHSLVAWVCMTCTSLGNLAPNSRGCHLSPRLWVPALAFLGASDRLEFNSQLGSWTAQVLLYFEIPVATKGLEKTKTPGCQRPLLLKGWIKGFFPFPCPCQGLCPSYSQNKESH